MRKLTLALLGAVLFSLIAPTISFGQTTNPNMNGWHAKYWFYRWRLRNDFMVMGEEPGQSLIAESRNLTRGQFMKWADATIMHGYYLTMLAIEHKILEDKGRTQDLKNNERELYFAIKAFERLDRVSETFYSSESGFDEAFRVGDATLPPDVNGYFFRDDVPPTFLNTNQFPDFAPNFTSNYYSLTNNKTGIDYGPMNYNQSDYSGLWGITTLHDGNSAPDLSIPQHPIVNYKEGTEDPDDENEDAPYGFGEASQDQIIRLLLGFFTIVKSIPDMPVAIDKDKDGINDVIMNFHDEAQRHSTNMIGRLAGQFSGTLNVPVNSNWPVLYWSLGVPGSPTWTLINPRERPADVGFVLYQYMIPMQMVADPLFTTNNDIGLGSSSYATIASYNPIAESLWNSGINGYDDNVNIKMALILNTISNSGSGFIPVPRFIANKSADAHIDGLYVPLYDYLWGWNPDTENDEERKQHGYDYANLMLEAAPCVGPHNFGYTNIPRPGNSQPEGLYSAVQDPDGIPFYWNVPFVFDVDHDRWDNGAVLDENGNLMIDEGWFSGMDYMLLYNLIYANNEGDKPLYHDLINRVVDYDINTDDYTDLMVYSGEGLMIGGFENLTVNANIYGNTPVTLKALDYVQLDEGIYDPNNMPEGITIEVGKITCGNDFTSSNTPYSIAVNNSCQTCGLENQVGSFVAPVVSGKDRSLHVKVPTFEEFEEQSRLNHLSGMNVAMENEVAVFPNPTADFFQIGADEEFHEVLVLDQFGSEVKRFVPSNNLYDIRELASGIYTIILTFNGNETKHIKVVKL